MNCYNTLSGFRQEDLPVFQNKLDFIVNEFSPEKLDEGFQRVLNIKGYPVFDSEFATLSLNVSKLLKAKESREWLEFRQWLDRSDSLSDKEIENLLGSLRSRLSRFINFKGSRVVRFLAVTGLGVLPIAGHVAGVLNSFVLNKVLPYSGPVAFINRIYPSLFAKKDVK